MFKKILSWLLIIQYLNVYVLQAAPEDLKIVFEEDRSPITINRHAPVPSRRLKILKEINESGERQEIFNIPLEVDGESCPRFRPTCLPITGDIRIEPSLDNTLHIFSKVEGNDFSLHFKPDGLTILQRMNISGSLDIETFGKIHIWNEIKATKLALIGRKILNMSNVAVDYLSLKASGRSSKGEIINSPEGHIIIGKRANILQGYFENRGTIEGRDGSVLDLHGNNFTNKYVSQDGDKPFRAQVNWQGRFSITRVGTFTNESDIAPVGAILDGSNYSKGQKGCSLKIMAKSLVNKRNKSNILATQGLRMELDDLTNDGKIEGVERASFKVNQFLVNRNTITSDGFLNIYGRGWLRNEGKGFINGAHTIIDIQEETRNEGLILSQFLSLTTRILQNFNKIHIGKEGHIYESKNGKGLVNHKGAEIGSKGSLEFVGQTLKNQGDGSSKGHIHANILATRLEQLENEGSMTAEKRGELQATSLTNGVTGTMFFTNVGTVTAKLLENKGAILGKMFRILVDTCENFATIKASKDLLIKVGKVLRNAGDAIISSVRTFIIEGKGKTFK